MPGRRGFRSFMSFWILLTWLRSVRSSFFSRNDGWELQKSHGVRNTVPQYVFGSVMFLESVLEVVTIRARFLMPSMAVRAREGSNKVLASVLSLREVPVLCDLQERYKTKGETQNVAPQQMSPVWRDRSMSLFCPRAGTPQRYPKRYPNDTPNTAFGC